jgi:hypothetical protein
MTASFYWNDPTMDTNAMRGGKGNPIPFGNGPNRFYYDKTLQYQAPRMGRLSPEFRGLGGLTPGTSFTIVTMPSGLTKAIPSTDAVRFAFQDVQRALNTAAETLRLPNRVKVTGEIEPPTAELALLVAQKARHPDPRLKALADVSRRDPMEALINTVTALAAMADSIPVTFRSIPPKTKLSPAVGTLAFVGVVLVVAGYWTAYRYLS